MGGCGGKFKSPFFISEFAIAGADECDEDENDENGSRVISPRTVIGVKAEFLATFSGFTEKDYMKMPIVKRYLMCIDKTRIEYNKKNKNNIKNNSVEYQQPKIKQGQKVDAADLFGLFS